MRRVLEFVLMAGGAFALAFGLDLLRYPAYSLAESLWTAGLGWAVFCLGVVLSLKQTPKSPQLRALEPVPMGFGPGPLGAVTLAFGPGQAPKVVSADPAVAVSADEDGTVRFRLQGTRAAGGLICRPAHASGAFFNTMKRDSRELQIKLFGPVPPVLHLELWDRSTL